MFLHLHNTIHHIAVTVTSTPAVTVTPTVTPSSAPPVTLVSTLLNPNAYGTVVSDLFGYNVSISGTRAIAGAPGESDAGGGFSGKAYIYDATNGSLLHTLDNPTPQAGANFGKSVAIDGNNAIVGAWVAASSSGKAYIYDVTTGNLLHTLDNPNIDGPASNDGFGYSVSIDGNYAIVGANNEEYAHIYDVVTGMLLYSIPNENAFGTAGGDQFGFSASISGNSVIIGAFSEDAAGGNSSGAAYIYNFTV
jgi:WD40 repeat protein